LVLPQLTGLKRKKHSYMTTLKASRFASKPGPQTVSYFLPDWPY